MKQCISDFDIIEKCKGYIKQIKYDGNINEIYNFDNVVIKRYKQQVIICNIFSSKYQMLFDQYYVSIKQGRMYRYIRNHIKNEKVDNEIINKCKESIKNIEYDGDITEIYNFDNAKIIRTKHKDSGYTHIDNIYCKRFNIYFKQYVLTLYKYAIPHEIKKKILDDKILKTLKTKYNGIYSYDNATIHREKGQYIIKNIYSLEFDIYFEQNYKHHLNDQPAKVIESLINNKRILKRLTDKYKGIYNYDNAIVDGRIKNNTLNVYINNIYSVIHDVWFNQRLVNHELGNMPRKIRRIISKNNFMELCNDCYGDRFDLTNIEYISFQKMCFGIIDTKYNRVINAIPNDFFRKYFNKYRTTVVYLLNLKSKSLNNEEFLKIGISCSIKNRISGISKFYDVDIIDTIDFQQDVESAYYYEQWLHNDTIKNEFKHNPEIKFPGYTECYTLDLLNSSNFKKIFTQKFVDTKLKEFQK